MSHRTREQKLARALQSVVQDETGVRPAYTRCLALASATPFDPRDESAEAVACRLFEAHRDELVPARSATPRAS